MALCTALQFTQGKAIYAVRSVENHAQHNSQVILDNTPHNANIAIGIYNDYGEAVDAGYLTLSPFNAHTFANARNNLPRTQWESQIVRAQAYMRRDRQQQGLSRALVNFAERNNLNNWKGYSAGTLMTVLCLLFAIFANVVLFKLTNWVYDKNNCGVYLNNATPQCMWSNRMKVNLAEHSHSLVNIIINKLFALLRNVTN